MVSRNDKEADSCKNYFLGTGITMERVSETRKRYPSWDVTTQNLSDHHLRVDFDPYMDMGM